MNMCEDEDIKRAIEESNNYKKIYISQDRRA